ncbi:MAG: insulinase family protein [Oscillospiraceae bacterium]|nr:insulinase family protein [Oscillospiraceae bacterium]
MSDLRQIEIAQGVDLCAVKTDMFKTGRISVTMALPLGGDIAANAALVYILRRSCAKYPDFTSLNGHLDELYGAALSASVTKLGEAQTVNLSISAIDDRFALGGDSVLESAAELLLCMLFEPKLVDANFTQEDVDIEKRLLLERMLSELDDKTVYAMRRCQELMCADEPFGQSRYGTREDILSLTPDRIYAAWKNMLATAVIRFVAVGSADADEIARSLKKRFESIERRPAATSTRFIAEAGEMKYHSEEMAVKQGKLVMGFRAGMARKDDYDSAMTVMCDVFGGGTYSKLFSHVREKMSLCYYCSSRLDKEKGLMMVQSGIETENEEKARAAILEQLDAVRSGDFTSDTFNASIMSINETLRSYDDSPEVLCQWYSMQLLEDVTKTTEERMAEINAVTQEQISEAANKVTLDTVFMLIGTKEDGEDEN